MSSFERKVRRARAREVPGYVERLLDALGPDLSALPRGTARHVDIRHDSWCALLARRGPCNCHPAITVGPDLARGDS